MLLTSCDQVVAPFCYGYTRVDATVINYTAITDSCSGGKNSPYSVPCYNVLVTFQYAGGMCVSGVISGDTNKDNALYLASLHYYVGARFSYYVDGSGVCVSDHNRSIALWGIAFLAISGVCLYLLLASVWINRSCSESCADC